MEKLHPLGSRGSVDLGHQGQADQLAAVGDVSQPFHQTRTVMELCSGNHGATENVFGMTRESFLQVFFYFGSFLFIPVFLLLGTATSARERWATR